MKKRRTKTRREQKAKQERDRQKIRHEVSLSPMTYTQLRERVNVLATRRGKGEYAGLPLPVREARLCVARKYPGYESLHGAKAETATRDEGGGEDLQLVNSWHREDRDICIIRERGKVKVELGWWPSGPLVRLKKRIDCIGISMTMDYAAEQRAVETLRTLIKPHMFNTYMMLGYFVETSCRSGVTYVFRRLAPTVAFRVGTPIRFLAALCLHPLAFYDGTPMGAMVPTDDVIAHLVMMRSDEVMFWRRSNQHGPDSPGAQL